MEFDTTGHVCLDPSDIHSAKNETYVSVPGTLKMAASGAYFHPDQSGKIKCLAMMESFLAAAKVKGWVKDDVFRSAFASHYPPSTTARKLANEVGALFSCGETDEIVNRCFRGGE